MEKLTNLNINFEEFKKLSYTLEIQDTPLQKPEMKQKYLIDHFENRDAKNILFEFNNMTNSENKRYFSTTGNGLFDCIQAAYALHMDLCLSADDLWISVCNNISNHINKNSEKYRHFFVNHEGKMELRVILPPEHFASFPNKQNRWDIVTDLLSEEIKKNTEGNIAEVMTNNFSTTTLIDKVGSQISLMATMKSYFDYVGIIPMCGIQKIHFKGGEEDFGKLVLKTKTLKQNYSLDESLSTYLTNIEEIFTKILEQISSKKADVDFWNQIIDQKEEYICVGSGCSKKVTYTGWIVKLFGLYNENKNSIERDEIPNFESEAPVKIIDMNQGGKQFKFAFKQSFYGFEEVAPNTLKPISNICIQLKDEENEQ
ncbi:hypothetical protein ABPG74_002066 [Tetrahymena malaccensis]